MSTVSMPNVWVVRADGGKYTEACVKGGYTGIGWTSTGNLSEAADRAAFIQSYKERWPQDGGHAAGNIARFRFDIRAGDYVITPAMDSKWLHYGKVADDPSYFYMDGSDGCPYGHRRKVTWVEGAIDRGTFSMPFQYKIRSGLTVYSVKLGEEFLAKIGLLPATPKDGTSDYDPEETVLNQILQLNDKQFETLVEHLLAALGFEDPEVVGKSGDGGVDVKGTLNASGLARVDVRVQAKRYQLDARVGDADVLKLRQVIPRDGQGAIITTAEFRRKAYEAASDPQFARVGLINGSQLVDLLVEQWSNMPEEFREFLELKPGLVLA